MPVPAAVHRSQVTPLKQAVAAGGGVATTGGGGGVGVDAGVLSRVCTPTARDWCVRCALDIECPAGLICQGDVCVQPGPVGPRANGSECSTSSECSSGECVTAPPFSVCGAHCSVNGDCPAGLVCAEAALGGATGCVPTTVSRCGAACSDPVNRCALTNEYFGRCTRPCTDNRHCPGGRCLNIDQQGQLSRAGECQAAAPTCGSDEIELVASIQLGAPYACGVFVPCDSDADCPGRNPECVYLSMTFGTACIRRF